MSKDKPDMYAENKAIMPYGDSVAAPKIVVPDTNAWVTQQSVDVNNYLSSKFTELKEEYAKLISLYKWNELVNKSEFSFILAVLTVYCFSGSKFDFSLSSIFNFLIGSFLDF